MSNFEQRKRDPFISETGAKELLDFNMSGLNDPEVAELLNSLEVDEGRKYSISTSIASYHLQNLILLYSIGTPIADMLEQAKITFEKFENKTLIYHDDDSKYSLTGNNDYQYVLWLLGLAYLLGLDEYIPKIATWISPRKKDGNDPLIAALFEKLGYPEILPSADKLLHPKGYSHLWEVVKNPQDSQEIQSQRMEAYIRGWYRNVMDKTVWKGWDQKGAIYFGFWSFEAAMVSVLYGLDDSDYRDMVFYPEDLADYAREKRQRSVIE